MTMSIAIATPSYAGDIERCRLLCASIDRFVTGLSTHCILVENRDAALFAPFAGPHRRIITESEMLPPWLRSHPDPLSLGKRRVWTGLRALGRGIPPLRGWHAQQLRKFAIASVIDEEVILFADSDMMFLRPFDLGSLVTEKGVRLYAKPEGIEAGMAEHVGWCEVAASLLGLPKPAMPSTDYINNLVSWRRDRVLELLALIEARSGRDWVTAIASNRQFSEYMIYGYYVERVLGLAAAGHFADGRELCKVYWGGDAEELPSLRSFEEVLEPHQVAVGVQSFIGAPMEQLKALFDAQ
jgi:hypothetical protein